MFIICHEVLTRDINNVLQLGPAQKLHPTTMIHLVCINRMSEPKNRNRKNNRFFIALHCIFEINQFLSGFSVVNFTHFTAELVILKFFNRKAINGFSSFFQFVHSVNVHSMQYSFNLRNKVSGLISVYNLLISELASILGRIKMPNRIKLRSRGPSVGKIEV